MRRLDTPPRADWRRRLDEYAYGEAAAPAAVSWNESVRYEFSADEIDTIEGVANEVHGLVHDAVRHLIERRMLALISLSPKAGVMIEAGWQDYWSGGRPQDRLGGLFGRLDFAYDGAGSLKLLGCDYDGPSGLFEASIVQWTWLQDRFPDADQFNGLHEGLVERWRSLSVGMRNRSRVHLTCATPDVAREGELAYLAATATEAGIPATTLAIQDVGWDGRRFFDLDEEPIDWLLKLYPWEAMLEEEYGGHLVTSGIPVLDPVWRLPASNHGLLATLWELYPEHPNLCRASLSERDLAGAKVILRRSMLGLDHPAERLSDASGIIAETAEATNPGGHVHIAMPPQFEADGARAILQAWMVGDACLGMTVRETTDLLVGPDAATVPHLFK
ncbi:MAG: glutathionylspermidine synthase family protein [Alphaproteobacteria bacterium]